MVLGKLSHVKLIWSFSAITLKLLDEVFKTKSFATLSFSFPGYVWAQQHDTFWTLMVWIQNWPHPQALEE